MDEYDYRMEVGPSGADQFTSIVAIFGFIGAWIAVWALAHVIATRMGIEKPGCWPAIVAFASVGVIAWLLL